MDPWAVLAYYLMVAPAAFPAPAPPEREEMVDVKITDDDLGILARTVYGEARGQPFEGQKAVAHVLINRYRTKKISRWDHSLAATALRKYQFSCWNPDDPNHDKMMDAGPNDAKFRVALWAALEALDGKDNTAGSTHYHHRSISPDWAKGKKPAVVIGDHWFYNDVI